MKYTVKTHFRGRLIGAHSYETLEQAEAYIAHLINGGSPCEITLHDYVPMPKTREYAPGTEPWLWA